MAKKHTYATIANRYIDDVLSAKIPACDWVKKACFRQRQDLERAKSGDWTYEFSEEKANLICLFVEQMPHVKGTQWAGKKIKLEPWQCFIYTTIFGWIYRDTGLRRFRLVYIECGRKNSKSTMSAPVGIYLTCADDEMGQEVYSAATTRDQAKIVWEVAKNMVQRNAQLRKHFGLDTSAHSVYQTRSGSKFVAVSAEGNNLDGLNGSSIIDELHAHRTRKVYDVLETAKAARQQPLLWNITTAGYDRSGICYEVRNYLTKILTGAADDESFFGVIYTLDPDDNWQDESVWRKANPNLNVSVDIKELRNLAKKAASMPSALTNFLTKHMNVWVNASVNLFDIVRWQELANPDLRPDQFKYEPLWIGFDFAPRNDFSSIVMLFRREEDDGTHFYVFAKHFLSEGKIEESENASYGGWAREGWITTNPGNQTSVKVIENAIVNIADAGYQVQELDCDPSRVQGIQELVAERCHITVVDIPQLPSKLCPSTEYLSALIADGKIHHNGDPVLTWMLSNVVGKHKEAWGEYPVKEFPENKIDGITALLIAMNRAMINEQNDSIYNHRDLILI